MILSVLGFFVILGIGTDDIFLMIDCYRMVKLQYPRLSKARKLGEGQCDLRVEIMAFDSFPNGI